MTVQFKTVETNTAPAIIFKLRRKPNDAIISLEDVTKVELFMLSKNANVITNEGHETLEILGDGTDGNAQYLVQEDDWPEDGVYLGDVKITYGDNSTEILYEYVEFIARKSVEATASDS